MAASPLTSIAVLGGGLAGAFAAARLARALPDDIALTLVDVSGADGQDLFFGTVTTPAAYNAMLGLGLGEPEIMPGTDTTFSLGTQYHWAGREWVQAFHQPLPVLAGVQFHQYAARARKPYPDFVMSVAAARRGAFAHPPEGQTTPLAELEYGYHFLPAQWAKLLTDSLPARVERAAGNVASVEAEGETLSAVVLEGGRTIKADLFIDTVGVRDRTDGDWSGGAVVHAQESLSPAQGPTGVVRTLRQKNDGWIATTPLRRGTHSLTLGSDGADGTGLTLGRREQAWVGNVLTFGLNATAASPLTPAPMSLLMRGADSLAELVPFTTEMRVEAREYNRRHRDDFDHALLFERAFHPDAHHPPRLAHKIEQFESRGALVQYDLEPFEAPDWLLLHLGMGRVPAARDVLADRVTDAQLHGQLATMRRAVETVAAKLPPAKVYHDGLLRYLGKRNG